MAHIRQSRPDYGLGFQGNVCKRQSRPDCGLDFRVKVLKTLYVVPSSFGSGLLEDEFKNNYFTEMCSGSKTGSYLRLIDFVYHSTLGLRVIKKKTNPPTERSVAVTCTLPKSSKLLGLRVEG